MAADIFVVDPHLHRTSNNFNFLRLLFALLVILSHTVEILDGNRDREIFTILFHTTTFGGLAVDGFFLLSGYLIVQSWKADPVAWTFLSKRALRIFPAFIVASVLCAFIVGPLGGGKDYFEQFKLVDFLVGMGLLAKPAIPPVFAGSHFPMVNGSMWSIHYEFVCYLFVLGFGLSRALRNPRVWLFATAALVVVNTAHAWGLQFSLLSLRDPLANPLVRLSMFFFVGGSFYLYRHVIVFRRRDAGIAAALLLPALYSEATLDLGLALAGGYLLFYFALTSLAGLHWFRRLPDVSYGTYLYGWPVTKLLIWYFPSISAVAAVGLTMLAALMLGAVSWYGVEKPFLKLKPGNHRQPALVPA